MLGKLTAVIVVLRGLVAGVNVPGATVGILIALKLLICKMGRLPSRFPTLSVGTCEFAPPLFSVGS
jgi:hypothetical protein